ncbi:MAG TPA: hypothetical protein VGB17_17900 [Pyrinomonadaceae bacterium]|jgi:hypothetical protein
MNNKLQPALIGGVLLGLLSAIPFINIANCCCLWVLLGGALATYLYIKRSPVAVSVGEGAQLGAMAGLIGAFINLIVGLPLNLLVRNPMLGLITGMLERLNPDQAEIFRRQMEMQYSMPLSQQLLLALPGALFGFLMVVVFATIGGLIAVPIFEKRKGGPDAPPPPPSFGGPAGGSYGGGV